MTIPAIIDLFALVPGKDEAAVIDGMLSRHQSLGIRRITWKIERHEGRDPGCRLGSPDYMRAGINLFKHAIVLFDRKGCGAEHLSREQLERELEDQLSASGWGDRAAAVVIDPELESWVWSGSLHVENALGWRGHDPTLREWLREQGYLPLDQTKPAQPKAATEAALRIVRKPRTSHIYTELAKHVSFTKCADPAFMKLLKCLRTWFNP